MTAPAALRPSLERVVTSLAIHFLSLEAEQVDEGIERALREVGTFANVDRAYAFRLTSATTMSNTHEWCREGIEPMIDHLQDIPVDVFPWFWEEIRHRRVVHVACVADLPEEAASDRAGLEEQGIVSVCAIPMVSAGQVTGFVGFDAVVEPKTWSSDDVELLTAVGDMFLHALHQKEDRRRIERLLRSKDEFVASVSHELRTPLTAVVGLAAELDERLDEFGRDEIRDFVAVIAEQSAEVAHIVDDLLVAARADHGLIDLQLVEFDLSAAVAAVGAGLGEEEAARISASIGPIPVYADPARVRQIVRNLVTNGLRYGGPRVWLEAESVLGTARLRVYDDGPGVPEADWERIFEPYHRLVPETQPGAIGLGLTVARRLARLMHGDLRYQPGPPGHFELVLPAAAGGDAAA